MSEQRSIVEALTESQDPLALIAGMYRERAGRQLSGDALRCYQFLQQNGSPDLAATVLDGKSYQVSSKDMMKMIEHLNPAQVQKQLIEWQAAAASKNTGS